MTAAGIVAIAVLGLLLGGVLNAVALRWDARFSSAFPPSYCLQADRHRRRHHAFPAWLPAILAAGCRCPDCGGAVEWRYAAAEPAAAVLFGYAAYFIGLKPELVPALLLIGVLLIIVQTDLTDMIIPNAVVAVAIAAALVIRLFIHPLPFWDYAAAAFVGSGALLLIGVAGSWLLKREAMGGGDIKLYVFIGLALGIKLTLLSLFLASIFGLIGGLVLMASGAHSRGKTIPFGPYIAAGALAAYFWGNGIITAYLSWIDRMIMSGL